MDKLESRTDFYLDQKFYSCWLEEIRAKIYWHEVSDDFAWHLLENTVRAYLSKSEYYFQGMDNVELTKIYQQCKIISILAKEEHGSES
jgi:hypothetical protein